LTLTGSQAYRADLRSEPRQGRDLQHGSVVGEVIDNLGVGGREGSGPSLEVVEVSAIGSPGCGRDTGFDVIIDRSG
jgi:hypothetical protein